MKADTKPFTAKSAKVTAKNAKDSVENEGRAKTAKVEADDI